MHFRENKTKVNMKWTVDETEVGYNLEESFVLDLEKSMADPHNVEIVQVNTVIVVSLCTKESPLLSSLIPSPLQ